MKHRIYHFFGWQKGHVVTIEIDTKEHWIAFQCEECGDLTGLCRVMGPTYQQEKERGRI